MIKNIVLLFVLLVVLSSPKFVGPLLVQSGQSTLMAEEFNLAFTRDFRAGIGDFEIYDVNGVYLIEGWAFLEGSYSPLDYSRELLLASTEYVYFSLTPVSRMDVANHFSRSDLEMSGFIAHVSKYELKVGLYRLWIVFRPHNLAPPSVVDTGYCISRTPNFLKLIENC